MGGFMRVQFAGILLASLFIAQAGCSPPRQSPNIIFVTATPAPIQPALPTLTPLPALPTATHTPEIPPTLPPIIPATPTNTVQAPPPPPPPPAQPTATPVLVALGVFEAGGGAMEFTMFGPSVATKFLVFRAIVCNPDCKNRPDCNDVNSVKFTFYKWNVNANQKGAKVYEHTENSPPYCSFGGSGTCDFINLADKNVKWPGTNTVIENGEYYFEVTAAGKNNRNWNGDFRFKVQR
jgi:hypothetical protein